MKTILTIPPSANRIWRTKFINKSGRVITYKAPDAVNWQEEAAWELKLSAKGEKLPFDKARVETFVYWPDNRKRDAANIEKILMDAIQDAGIVEDDKDIKDHRTVVMGIDREKPRLEIEISRNQGI